MISIAMFNNKGGVGKTTLLCNLAGYLQIEKKKKVLVVDADPQCNTTTYVLDREQFDDLYGKIADGRDADTFTIRDLVEPLKAGEGYITEGELKIIQSKGFGFSLIPGNPKFASLEDFLSRDWIDIAGKEVRGIKTTMFAFHLLSMCKEYDYVFFDMGPALGAINRSILLACNYFITPMSSDIFSLLALDNIGMSICEWKKEFNDAIESLETEAKERVKKGVKSESIACSVRFFGHVTQQYITKMDGDERRAVKAYDNIMKRFPSSINEKIIKPINFEGMSCEKNEEILGRIDYEIGKIPNFYSLIPMSQSAHKPLFSLGAKDGVVGAHYRKVDEFKKLMSDMVNRFFENEEKLNELFNK